jgi:hypothetical protein
VLETAPAARTTVQSPLRWREDHAWKRDFMNTDALSPDTIAARRREFDEHKTVAHRRRDEDG